MKQALDFIFRRGGSMFGITWKLIWEMILAILGRVAWRVVAERFLTRALVEIFVWLKTLNTNELYQDTVDSILHQLRGKGLKMAEENISDRKRE